MIEPSACYLGEYFWFIDDGVVKEGEVVSTYRKGCVILSAFDNSGTFRCDPKELYETEKECRLALKGNK